MMTAIRDKADQRTSDQLAEQAYSSCLRLGSEIVWQNLPRFIADPRHLEQNRIVTPFRSDLAYVAFNMLRTTVFQQMRQNNWKSVAITSPTQGCGKSVVGLNLAFSLANQKEFRTALLDLDLRRPQIARLLGMKTPPSLESFLKGQIEAEDIFVRYGDNLAIAGNAQPVLFSAELLQSTTTLRALKSMKQKLDPDMLIVDMPPMLSCDDVAAFLPNVDCAILVIAAEMTTIREADLCERSLSESTNMLGVVLNKCRYTPDKYGY